jgi:sRNA-binding regulator protein Hfq
MSLGDTLRLLRAQRDGVTPAEIEAALPELPKGLYRYMEQRYRAVGDDNTIRMLAGYFGVPFEDLRWRLDWPRKALNRALFHAEAEKEPITLELWTGEKVTGTVKWWDLGATEIETTGGGVIVQRHAVERWDPRAAESTADEAAEDDM